MSDDNFVNVDSLATPRLSRMAELLASIPDEVLRVELIDLIMQHYADGVMLGYERGKREGDRTHPTEGRDE